MFSIVEKVCAKSERTCNLGLSDRGASHHKVDSSSVVVVVVVVVASSSRTDRWVHFQQNAAYDCLYTLELCTASMIATTLAAISGS